MKKIISVLHPEWIKILNYRTFWILTGIYAATLILLLFSVEATLNKMTINVSNQSHLPIPGFSIYSFPEVWHNLTYIAGFLKMFPAFLIIILITNEFTFHTLKQQIITGTSRLQFIAGKIGLILLLSISVALLVGLSGLVVGLMQDSVDYTAIISPKLWFIPAHALELFTYLMFAAFLAFLLKRAGIAVIVLLLYSLIIEKILVFRLPKEIGTFLPLQASSDLVPLPDSPLMKLFGISFHGYSAIQDAGICVIWILIFAFAIYRILMKRDL